MEYPNDHWLALDDELRAEKEIEQMETIAQIEYINKDGENVHSDICPPNHDIKQITKEYRQFLHDCLDEWLNRSAGTGCFFIGEPDAYNERIE